MNCLIESFLSSSKLTFPAPSVVEYNDSIGRLRNVYYGISHQNMPISGPRRIVLLRTVVAGEKFQMSFHSTFLDETLYPHYYRVLYHSLLGSIVLPGHFGPLNWTWNSPLEYHIYAYLETIKCFQWKNMQFVWHRATIQGTACQVHVLPKPSGLEGYSGCPHEDDITIGRFLSTSSAISKQFADIYTNIWREFAWAPYQCRFPRRPSIQPPRRKMSSSSAIQGQRGHHEQKSGIICGASWRETFVIINILLKRTGK